MSKTHRIRKTLMAMIAVAALAALAAGCGGGGGAAAPSSSGSSFARMGASVRFGSSQSSRIAGQYSTSTYSFPSDPYYYQECGDMEAWLQSAAQTTADSTSIPVYLSVIDDPQYINFDPYAFSYPDTSTDAQYADIYGTLLASACATVERSLGRVVVYRNSGTFTIDNVLADDNLVLTAVAFTGSSNSYMDGVQLAKIVSVEAGQETSGIVVSPESTLAAFAISQYASQNSLELSDVPAERVAAVESAVAALFPSGFSFGSSVTPTGMRSVTFNSPQDFYLVATGTAAWTDFAITQSDVYMLPGEVTLESACSTAAMAQVETARTALFKTTVASTDYDTAKAAADAALADSPNCPDANFVSALLDLMGETERVGTTLLANPQPLFPFENYSQQATTLGRTVSSVTEPIIGGLPRIAPVTTGGISDYSTAAEIQAALEGGTLTVLAGALTKLNAVRTAIATDSTWAFTYYKDPANPSLGTESITANDIDLITGAYEIILGWVNYVMAYNLDVPTGYSSLDPCPIYTDGVIDTTINAISKPNYCVAADVNTDFIITPTEAVPPSPFGTPRTSGTAYLSAAQSYIVTGLSLIDTAATNILAAGTPAVGGLPLTSSVVTNAAEYKQFISKLSASFNGTATAITWYREVFCWTTYVSNGTTYYMVDDMQEVPENTEHLAACVQLDERAPALTVTANLGAIFGVTDFRSVMPNYIIEEGYMGYDIHPDATQMQGFTYGGLFPGGVQSTWFDFETPYFNFYFNLEDANGQPVTIGTGVTGSLLVDGKTFTISSDSYTNLGGFYSNMAMFNSPFNPWNISGLTSLPTASDFISLNEKFGVTATLTITGYQPVTVKLYDSESRANVVLTPM